jgi:hypothetical protein
MISYMTSYFFDLIRKRKKGRVYYIIYDGIHVMTLRPSWSNLIFFPTFMTFNFQVPQVPWYRLYYHWIYDIIWPWYPRLLISEGLIIRKIKVDIPRFRYYRQNIWNEFDIIGDNPCKKRKEWVRYDNRYDMKYNTFWMSCMYTFLNII